MIDPAPLVKKNLVRLRNLGASEVRSKMGSRLTWRQICRSEDFRGRWVALDNCRYDQSRASPTEGDVVDADEDLAELCRRMREADKTHCAIAFCEDEVIIESPPPAAPISWRTVQH